MALVSSTINCRRVSNLCGSSREGEGHEQPQQAEDCTFDDPALRRRARSGWRAPPEADPSAHFQKEQHAEK